MSTTLAEPILQPGPDVKGPPTRIQLFQQFLWAVLPFAILYIVSASHLALQDDEAYYWCWTERLQLSYYDHAPMTAWMIAASTAAFGHSVFAIRIPTLLCALVALYVVYTLTRPRSLFPLIALTPAFAIVAIVITPDSPLIGFWALYVLWLVKLHERLDAEQPTTWLWVLGGILLGCCILGKYTAALAIPSGLATFWFVKDWRRCVLGYAVHLFVAFLVSLPILIYNIQEEFVPLLYQWRHATENEPWTLKPLGEFVGLQLITAGILPLLVFGWALFNHRKLASDPRLRVCLCLFVIPFAFFCYRGVRMRMEANWTLISYVAVWPLAAAWYDSVRHSFRWRMVAFGSFVPSVIVTAILAAHTVHPIPVLSARADRVSRQTSKEAVSCEVAAKVRERGNPAPVYVRTYQWASLLRFQGVDAYPMDENRHNHFTKMTKRPRHQDRAYVFDEGFLSPEEAGGLKATVVAHFPLKVRGEMISVITLYEYAKP